MQGLLCHYLGFLLSIWNLSEYQVWLWKFVIVNIETASFYYLDLCYETLAELEHGCCQINYISLRPAGDYVILLVYVVLGSDAPLREATALRDVTRFLEDSLFRRARHIFKFVLCVDLVASLHYLLDCFLLRIFIESVLGQAFVAS